MYNRDRGPISPEERRRLLNGVSAQLMHTSLVIEEPGFVAFVDTTGGGSKASLVRRGDWIGVGYVRLDSRPDLEGVPRSTQDSEGDLSVVLRHLELRGPAAVASLIGDYAFAAYNVRSHTLFLARDAFGVRPIHYRLDASTISVSSESRSLVEEERYDLEFIGPFLVTGEPPQDRTPFKGVKPVVPGHLITLYGQRLLDQQYWSSETIQVNRTISERDAVAEFRERFMEAVRLRLESSAPVWSRLSGGLDSSSVVCVAQSLAQQGLAPRALDGTITTVDSLGRGDETEFVGCVLARYPTRNETVRDYWMWYDDGEKPPLTDLPTIMYPFFARDRYGASVVRQAGAKVMLCGLGADHYLTSPPDFIADYLASGHLGRALRELTDWSVAYRMSFWKFARKHAIVPFLSRPTRLEIAKRRTKLPNWVNEKFATQLNLHDQLRGVKLAYVKPGHLFRSSIQLQMSGLGASLQREMSAAGLETRYPFLHRPLVEFALSLPASMIERPHQAKWVLRQALSDIVPNAVRTRSGKGTIGARIRWSITRESERVAELLRDPILADLGCVDTTPISRALRRVQQGKNLAVGPVLPFLALETWLRVRSGRWAVKPTAEQRAS